MKLEKRIGVSVLTRVSEKGAGFYLYLPKDHARTYGIDKGDRVEVRLVKCFKEVAEKPDPSVVDVSEANSRRRRRN